MSLGVYIIKAKTQHHGVSLSIAKETAERKIGSASLSAQSLEVQCSETAYVGV